MSQIQRAIFPSPHPIVYSDIDDDNAIITSFATAASEDVRSTSEFNGALGTVTQGGVVVAYSRMHQIVAVSAANVGSYVVGSTLTAVGTDQHGQARTLTATVGSADGGETLAFVDSNGDALGMMTITSITIEAQADTSGAWQIGVRDIIFDQPIREIIGGAAGNIAVENEHGFTATLPIGTAGNGFVAYIKKIFDTGTTAFPVTVLL